MSGTTYVGVLLETHGKGWDLHRGNSGKGSVGWLDTQVWGRECPRDSWILGWGLCLWTKFTCQTMRYHLTLTCSSEISSPWIICTPFSFLLSLLNFESLILRPRQHLSWMPTLSLTVSPSFSRALGDTLRTVFIWLTFWFPYIFLTLPLSNLLFLFLFLTHNCVDIWENRWSMTPEAFFQLLAQTQGKSVELNLNTVESESGGCSQNMN